VLLQLGATDPMRAASTFFLLVACVGAVPLMRNNETFLNSTGASGCTYDDSSFDYLLLVQQWPAAQQSASWPAGAIIDDFTLHGLWPSRIGSTVNSYPCECTKEAFDESKVSASLSEMKQRWPSYTGENDQFWDHEWSKHGTCCDDTTGLSSQATFFSSTLALRDKVGILKALAAASITPGKSYSYASMAAAVKASLGVNPLMGCKTGNTLSEMGICYTKTMEPQECDDSVKTQSGDEVSDCDQTVAVNFAASAGPSPSPTPPTPTPPSPTPPSPSSGKCADLGCKFTPGAPCQCNSNCDQYDDCCPDYQTVCGGPGPSPTPTPSPGGQCVAGQHGPACSSDSDCTSISQCVRCASSGYCTCSDKSTGKCA